MLKIILRLIIDVVFGVITLPIRVLLIVCLCVIAPIHKIKYDISMRDTFEAAKGGCLKSLRQEKHWIKTGKLYEWES